VVSTHGWVEGTRKQRAGATRLQHGQLRLLRFLFLRRHSSRGAFDLNHVRK
jgi:hypothetical protein